MVRPPYQAAVRLCTIAADRWPQIEAAYYQINLLRQPPYRFVNLVYAWAIEHVEADKIEEWEAELIDLLPWQESSGNAGAELESDSFMTAMNTN